MSDLIFDKLKFFNVAIDEAVNGIKHEHGAPFGACIVMDNQIIASAHDTVLKDNDATCHAEINAIRQASKKLCSYSLKGCYIFCTSEPCPMCMSAIYWAELSACYFGAGKALAASYGFKDDFIYEEFNKAIDSRSIPCESYSAISKKVKQIFEDWRRKGLPVC